MSRKGIIILAALFGVAFVLLAVGRCGYRRIEALQSIDKAEASFRRDYPRVEPVRAARLAEWLDSDPALLLVDARDPEEFAVSRLPGAVNLRDVDAVRAHRDATNPPPDRVVVYGALGFRSIELAEELGEAGVPGVRHLRGGIFAWANEDRPLVDAEGRPAERVHPYNRIWGRLLEPGKRLELEGYAE